MLIRSKRLSNKKKLKEKVALLMASTLIWEKMATKLIFVSKTVTNINGNQAFQTNLVV